MEYNATVIAREELSPGNIVLRIKPDGELFDFESGQFAVLGLHGDAPRADFAGPEPEDDGPSQPDKPIRRAYSIASSSREREYVEFFGTLVASGQLTPRLFDLELGSRLFLSPRATGLFTLDDVPGDQHVVFLSTGTGLAPYMSMLRTHLLCGEPRKFVVLHGARVSWDLGYRAELETPDRLCGNFAYVPAITRPAEDPSFSDRPAAIADRVGGDHGEVQPRARSREHSRVPLRQSRDDPVGAGVVRRARLPPGRVQESRQHPHGEVLDLTAAGRG